MTPTSDGSLTKNADGIEFTKKKRKSKCLSKRQLEGTYIISVVPKRIKMINKPRLCL